MLDDKDIDAVVIATPNHWHALATIWALQAGKHVYVEKPSPTRCGKAARWSRRTARYNKIVQVGTMNRSRPAVREAIKFIHDGGIGKVYMARGLCFKPRPAIGKYPDGPMAAGETVQAERRRRRPSSRPTTPRTCRRSTTTCGSARRRSGRSTATASTTTGTGTGTTATATPATRARTSSTSRAGAWQAGAPGQDQLGRRLLRPPSRRRRRPNLQTTLFEYADGTVLEFGTRGEASPTTKARVEIGNLFYGTEGLAVDRRRRPQVAVVPRAARTRRARAPTPPAGAERQRPARARRASSRRTTRTSSTPSAPTIRSC